MRFVSKISVGCVKSLGVVARLMSFAFIAMIYVYKYFLSPLLPKACRYYPSCSEYALISFKKYNFLKSFLMVINRIKRCNCYNAGGVDEP